MTKLTRPESSLSPAIDRRPLAIAIMLFLIGFITVTLSVVHLSVSSFQPRAHHKEIAHCNAKNPRNDNDDHAIAIALHYVDINPSEVRSMIMVHGWPSLWSTWSHQIEEFKGDYRLLVPDLRGFGPSIHASFEERLPTMTDLVGDLVCILENAQVDSAICVGHDWGSQVCYEGARMRPDVFTGVVGITVPYIPSGPEFIPISALLPSHPRLAYQLFLDQNATAATAELDADIRRTIRATFRSVDSPPPDPFLTHEHSFLEGWSEILEIPPVPFLTPEEEDYLVEQYTIQGFGTTLHFYSQEGRYVSWHFANEQANHTIPQPVLSILPLDDPVADWVLAAKILHSAEFLPQMTMRTIPGAHWIHMENPHLVNEAMRVWVNELTRGNGGRQGCTDEL